MNTETIASGPPAPPGIERPLQFARLQLVGMPLTILVALLAVFGLLAGACEQRERSSGGVHVRVGHANRVHDEADARLSVAVVRPAAPGGTRERTAQGRSSRLVTGGQQRRKPV